MKNYELTIVLSGKTTPAKKKALIKKLKGEFDKLKVKTKSFDDMGEKDFAYPISKNNSGIFLFYELELDAKSVSGLNQSLRMDESILRYLFVKIQ